MRRPQNLLDIKSHCLITNIMFLFLSIDQMKNGYLQYYHNQLGPKRVFQIWSNVFIIENLGWCNFQIIKQVMLKSCIDWCFILYDVYHFHNFCLLLLVIILMMTKYIRLYHFFKMFSDQAYFFAQHVYRWNKVPCKISGL